MIRFAMLLIVPLSCLVACGDDSNDNDTDDTPLTDWQGTWQAAEPLFRDPGTDSAYQAIHDLRPEYSVDEIRGLFLSTADVDYTSLEVGPSTLTFLDGTSTVCEGRYAVAADGSDEQHSDFELVSELAGDCERYTTVSATGQLPVDPEVHFHIVTGDSSGPLHPPPWNPSVWTPTTTADFFAAMFEQQAPMIADALPPKDDG